MAYLVNYRETLKKKRRDEVAVRKEDDKAPDLISLEKENKYLRRRDILGRSGCCARMVEWLVLWCPNPLTITNENTNPQVFGHMDGLLETGLSVY